MSLASKISKAVSEGTKKSSSKSKKAAKEVASVPLSPEEYGPKTVLPKKESSKNFEKKFKETKVVDENQKPALLYHGRTKDYEAFDTSGGSSSVQELGTHLGTKEQANDFATYYGGNVVPAYVDIKNPLRLEDRGGFQASEVLDQLRGYGVSDEIADQIEDLPVPEQMKAVSALIKGMGHDGIVYLNKREGLNLKGTPEEVSSKLDEIQDYDDDILRKEYGAKDSYIILDPTQAKSPFNKGTYSETDDRFNYNKGGSVKTEMKKLLAKGGLKHQGGTKDPISGNNVPIGATQEEVRDDIPAQLSEGEFVFPADVVRYIGLERLMMMRQAAKKGLMKMEDMGQMSNGDEGDEEEDTAEFESQIDEIIGVLGGREKGEMEEDEEDEEAPRKMAEGGMPMPAPAAPMPAPVPPMSPTQQAIPMSAPAPAPAPMAAEAPAQGIASEIDLPQRVESKPTEGLKSSDIIRNNLAAEATPEQTEMFLKQIAMLETASKAISVRHNDTVVIGFVKDKGVVDPIVFSENEPEEFDQAINVAMDTFKKSGVTRLESSSPDRMIIEYLTNKGFPVEEGTPESGFTWALDL